MKRTLLPALVLVSLVLAAPLALAQGEVDWTKVAPAEKLMARRAARLDALRELSELVKSLPVGGGQTVGDLRPDISVFLAGATEVGEPKYLATGYVKLTMQLPGERVVGEAVALARERGVGVDLDRLRRAVGASLEATGLGLPRSLAKKADDRQGQLEAPKDKRFAQQPGEKDRMARRDPTAEEPGRRPQAGPAGQPGRENEEPKKSERRMERLLEETPDDERQPARPPRAGQPPRQPQEQGQREEGWDDFDRRFNDFGEDLNRRWQQMGEELNRRWRSQGDPWARKTNEWEARNHEAARRWQDLPSLEEQYRQGRPIGGGWRLLPDGSRVRILSEEFGRGAPAPRMGSQVIRRTIIEEVIEERPIVK